MQPAPVPDGASQPGSKAKLYQTGAKGVDQVSSTMRRRCFFRRGAPISKCALLTLPEEEDRDGGSVRGRVRLHKSQQDIRKRVRLASSKAAKILNHQSPTCSHTILVRPNQGTARSQSGQQSTPQGQHPHRSRNISSGRKPPVRGEALLSATPAQVLLVASRRLGWCSATGAAVLNVRQAAVQLAILSGPLRGEGGALNAVDSEVEGKGPVGAQSLASPSMGSRSQSLLCWCCGVREYKGAVV
ncbi:hypothetical protein HDV62DRAFT_262547 [Trichoderma sp. SZMC 28011]